MEKTTGILWFYYSSFSQEGWPSGTQFITFTHTFKLLLSVRSTSPFLPTQRAGETTLHSPAPQAAGAEGVVAVQKARVLVLLMAQEAH